LERLETPLKYKRNGRVFQERFRSISRHISDVVYSMTMTSVSRISSLLCQAFLEVSASDRSARLRTFRHVADFDPRAALVTHWYATAAILGDAI
jgi:hypothetical protein